MLRLTGAAVLLLIATAAAFPDNIQEAKTLPQTSDLNLEAEPSNPQERTERCAACGSGQLQAGPLAFPSNIAAKLQSIPPGTVVHSQSSFEGCSTEQGCAGIKVKDGQIVERYGNVDAFKAASSADTANEFSFHAGLSGNEILEGGIPKNGPFWWMKENSPFRDAFTNYEKFSKTSSSSSSSGGGAGGGSFSASLDLSGNPFLNGDASKLASGFLSGQGGSATFGASSGGVDISSNPFLNGNIQPGKKTSSSSFSSFSSESSSNFGNGAAAGNLGGNGKFGAQGSFQAGQFSAPGSSSVSKFSSSGYIGSSPSPFTASTGANVNRIESTQKNNELEFDQQQQTQQNIDEIYSQSSLGGRVEHNTGELQQTCAGQGYTCVHKAQCNNGVVNTNGAGILQAATKKQYCNTKTEICCRIEVATVPGAGVNLQGVLGVGSSQFSGSGSGQNIFGTNSATGSFGATASETSKFGSASNSAGSNSGFGAGSNTGASGSNGFQSSSSTFESSSTFGSNSGSKTGSGFGTATGSNNAGSSASFGAGSNNAGSSGSFGAGANNAGSTGSFGAGSNTGASGSNGFQSSSSTFESSSTFGSNSGSKTGSGFGGNAGNSFNAADSNTAGTNAVGNAAGGGSFNFKETSSSSFNNRFAGNAGNNNGLIHIPPSTGTGGVSFTGTKTSKTETDSFSSGTNTNGVFRPGNNPGKPGIPYLPPVDVTAGSSNTVSATVSYTPAPTPRPFSPTPTGPGYLPPQGEQSINRPTFVPGPRPEQPDTEGSLLLGPNREPNPRPRQPFQPAISEIPAGCAAALKCTPIEFCTAEGVISNTTVRLSKDQEDFRVPLTDCKDIASGAIGKCCRDPTYTDPWPTNQLGKWVPGVFGGDDGAYKPDSRGSPNNPTPSRVRPNPPPNVGGILLNNYRTTTEKPSYPYPGPNQVTPGYGQTQQTGQSQVNFVGIQGQGVKGQTGIGSRGQFGQGQTVSQGFGQSVTQGQGQITTQGQGQVVSQGQGQYEQQGQGQFGAGSQGQFGAGSQGQYGQTFKKETTQTITQGSFGQTGQGQIISQGQGAFGQTGQGQSISQGQGTFGQTGQGQIISQGQGAFGQTGQGQIVSQGQGQIVTQEKGQFGQVGQGILLNQGQGQFGQSGQGQIVSKGQGQIVTQGQGEIVSQGQGQIVSQGQGQIVSQGQGQIVSEGQGQFGQNAQGQFGQTGQGQIVSKGQGQIVSQGQGQIVSQGQGQYESQGQGQYVSQGQGQLVNQGQGGFGQVENAYSESVQRVFLTQYGAGGQCGLLKGQKPYGNRNDLEVDFAEIPWQAMVLLETNRSLLCGGVITRPEVVITSAACVDGLQAKHVLIKGGEWKLGIDEEPLPFQIVQVKTILRHPGYRVGSLHNDVAILVLAEKLRFANNIYPICLPNAADTLDGYYNGAGECIVTGWGKQVLQAHIAGAIMHSLNVSLINPGECQAKISEDYPHLLEQYDAESCACGQPTNPINNICKVDIGSALACTTGDGHFVLRGIYSWDSGCQAGNQLAAFYKFDLEWYEWALGLSEGSGRFTSQFGGQATSQQRFSQSQFSQVSGSGIKGGFGGFNSGIKGGLVGGQLNAGIKGGNGFSSRFSQSSSSFSNQNAGAGDAGKFGFTSQTQLPAVKYQYETKTGPVKSSSFSASYSSQEKQFYQGQPQVISYTTKPEIITYTTKPKIVTYTTKPEIFTYTTKPKIVTFTTKPQIVTYETSGSGINPQYVAPGVTYNPQFSDVIGKTHAQAHGALCQCENGK